MASERAKAYTERVVDLLGGLVPLDRMPGTMELLRDILADLEEEAYAAGFEAGGQESRDAQDERDRAAI